jgi:DNA-binding beta-propeller fold protein YncE
LVKTKFIIYFAVFLPVMLISNICFAEDCFGSRFLFDIKTEADQPSDLAIGPKGNIYLVDGVNNRIIVVDNTGKRKFEFGQHGEGQGEFKYPLGIDISDNGKVFIADTGNHRIQVFNLKGDFKYLFNVKSGPEEKPSDPVDVLASGLNDYLYISDNDNHKIKVYNQKGTFEFEWGRFGEEPGEFRYPGILAQNEYNEVFVVDVLNTRVQKFDPFGNFIAEIGSWGVLPGNLFRPKGVAVDKKNRIFVTDSYMGVIQVFTDLGRFVGVICENNKNKTFVTPVGIVIDDKAKRLLVVEMRANKISVLKLSP